MPSLEIELFNKIKEENIFTKFPVFIETGTFKGETIFKMEKLFNELHTIEIKKSFYDNVKNNYNGKKINFHYGDSSDILTILLPRINQKCVIFLDGHWSSGNTGRGKKDCPLFEELTHINNLLNVEAIIIIDDCRLFGKGPNIGNMNENWEDINKDNLLNVINNRIKDVYFLPSIICNNDRLIIHINSIL